MALVASPRQTSPTTGGGERPARRSLRTRRVNATTTAARPSSAALAVVQRRRLRRLASTPSNATITTTTRRSTRVIKKRDSPTIEGNTIVVDNTLITSTNVAATARSRPRTEIAEVAVATSSPFALMQLDPDVLYILQNLPPCVHDSPLVPALPARTQTSHEYALVLDLDETLV